MLKKFEVRNYRNFKESIVIDFSKVGDYPFSTDCICDGMISKMLIYGKNATGKTNLGKALIDIQGVLLGRFQSFREGTFLNADTKEDSAFFSYTFLFGKDEIIYQYSKFSNQNLKEEKLILNGNLLFHIDFISRKNYVDLTFTDFNDVVVGRYLYMITEEYDSSELLETKMPFLRWMLSNVALDQNSPLRKMENYVMRMVRGTVGSIAAAKSKKRLETFFEDLMKEDQLKAFEEFLNAMGVICRLTLKDLPDGEKELYFVHGKLVPFYGNASSGTLILTDIYRTLIIRTRKASFVYLDEFDAFFHHDMAENMLHYLKKNYPDCQIILTSHNTNLMSNRYMRPDCLFILSQRAVLTPLCDATLRELREGHNLEKMYISGEFEKYE